MKENVMSLHGNIALVTGASRGIGQAIACELGSRGAIVIGTATTDSGAEAITSNLTQLKIQGRGLRLNVAEAESAGEVIDIISTEYGAPTILVNNAGITRDNLLMRMKDEEWEAIISTNLSSVYRLSKAVLRSMMKARSGRIINITSVVGVTGNAGQTNYAAAKAGLIGFTKSLAREVGSRGITVNAVAPGFIDTDMTRSLADDQRNKRIQSIPLSRLGDVRDIAHAVAFLASAEASYITGETLHVNGGMHMS
jgi:3-oxoacyl-[acyl-carrier protein] reductase